MTDNNLHSRQFKLYNYLKKNKDKWVTQAQIARDLPAVYPCREEDFNDFHNSTARYAITNDIRALNDSGLIQKVILSNGKGVKIANEEEFNAHIGGLINSAVRRLQRVKKIAEKGSKNGQLKIKLSPYEREEIKAFIE